MDWSTILSMDLSTILNFVFGTGLVATLISLLSIRSELRKVRAEAKKAEAEADSVKITNTENATRILVQNIVEPLREELDATRKELYQAREELKEVPPLKRQVVRLCKAMEAVKSCPYNSECPVRDELQKSGDDASSVLRTSSRGNSNAHTRSGGRRQRNAGGQASRGFKRKGGTESASSGNLETDEPAGGDRLSGQPEGEGQTET